MKTQTVTMTNEVAKIINAEEKKPEIVISTPGPKLIKEEWVSLAKTLGALVLSAVITTILKFVLDQVTTYAPSGELEMTLMAALTMVIKYAIKAVETTKYVR